MQLSRRWRNCLVAAAVFLAGLLVFFVYWKLARPRPEQYYGTVAMNDMPRAGAVPLEPHEAEHPLVQRFYSPRAFRAVRLEVEVGEPKAGRQFYIAVTDDAGRFLAGDFRGIFRQDETGWYAVCMFDGEAKSEDGNYVFSFYDVTEAPYETGGIGLVKSAGAPGGWQLTEPDGTTGGTLCFSLLVETPLSFFVRWYWLFAPLVSLLCGGLALLGLVLAGRLWQRRGGKAPRGAGRRQGGEWKKRLAAAGGFVRRHRAVLAAVGVLLLCLGVFFAYWRLEVAEARGKSRALYLNDEQQATTRQVGDGTVVEQVFVSNQPFHAIGVAPMYAGAPPAGSMAVQLYDGAETLLAEASGPTDTAAAGSYAVFVFGDTISSADGIYRLVFTAHTDDAALEYTLLKSDAALDGWTLREGGEAAEGALCLRISTDRVGSFLTGWYWAFAGLGSVLCAALCFLWLRGVRLHRLFAVAAAGLGVLFCLVLPPYAAPDEQFHINQSYNLSSALLGQGPLEAEWGANYRRVADSDPALEVEAPTVFTWRAVARGFFERAQDTTTVRYEGEEVGPPRMLHLPAALGVTLGRLLGLGYVATLYLGRAVMLALYVFLAALAVKLAPRGKAVFAVVGLLPMSLHMAASYNRDGLVIALFMLFCALCMRYALEKRRLDVGGLVALAALAFVAAPAKAVYLPMLLLVLCIPAQRFHLRGRPLTRLQAGCAKCAVLLVGFVSLVGFMGGSIGVNAGQPVVAGVALPVRLLQALFPAAAGAGPAAVLTAPVTYTLGDLLRMPATILWLVLRTVAQQFLFWVQTVVGANLGYYNTPLSWGWVIFFVLLLAAAVLPAPQDAPLGRRRRAAFGLMALGTAGLVVLACVLWTPVGADILYGVQGRYFLPMLPLGLCALGRSGGAIRLRRSLAAPLTALAGCGGVFVLLNTFLVVLAR